MLDFTFGCALGASVFAFMVDSYINDVASVAHNNLTEIRTMIVECGSQLSRNKRCILVAQPEE